jgi:hypothetical protein
MLSVFFALLGAIIVMAVPGPAGADDLVLFGAGQLGHDGAPHLRDPRASDLKVYSH